MKDVIGFVGSGNMAEAIISAIVKNGFSAKRVFISDIDNTRLNYVSQKYRVQKCGSNTEVVKQSDIVFLAVKPYQIEEVLKEISGLIKQTQIVISIAAGIRTQKIEKYLKKISVIRVMPNTPAVIGEGAIAICKGRYTKTKDMELAEKLLSYCGIVVKVSEKVMDAVTAISGSGPAYIFYIAEIIQKTAQKIGLQKKVAQKLVNQTLLGAAKMIILSDETPEILRQKVTSKKGTTEAAFRVLTKQNFAKILEQAIISAMKRAKNLSLV
ncbi:MAG: pyrroline-5-carboxylate reductase [Elusimicrobiota bacterium]